MPINARSINRGTVNGDRAEPVLRKLLGLVKSPDGLSKEFQKQLAKDQFLQYQIDAWSKRNDDIDDYEERLVSMVVTIDKQQHRLDMHISNEPDDAEIKITKINTKEQEPTVEIINLRTVF